MMKILVKTVETENGCLYEVKNGERYLLSELDIRVEIYEERTKIPILNGSQKMKKRHYNIVICGENNLDFDVNATYQATVDVRKPDNVYKRIYFDELMPEEINIDGEWIFSSKNKFKEFK